MDPWIPQACMVTLLDLLMPCHVFQQAGVMPQYTDTSILLQISFRWVPSDKRQQMVIDKVDARS